jgi:hypothetical protein
MSAAVAFKALQEKLEAEAVVYRTVQRGTKLFQKP